MTNFAPRPERVNGEEETAPVETETILRSLAARALVLPYVEPRAVESVPAETATMSSYGKTYDSGMGSEG